jgi:type VI secretion system protein ImpB
MSSQKFIARNRAPRVQIEYDVELYGAQKKIQLPFVMGVMADLSGQPAEPLPPVAERKFLEISAENFDDRLKAMKPRVAFQVPNKLTGEGNVSVDITFESLDDFSPGALARKIEPLNQLLEARNQLKNLITYMDGKTGAEDLLAKVLKDPQLLKSLAAAPKPAAPGEGEETGVNAGKGK